MPGVDTVTTPGTDMPGDYTPHVNVIVVAYGPVTALTEALETLGAGASVVVVDNGSSSATENAVVGAGRDMSTPAGTWDSRRRSTWPWCCCPTRRLTSCS